MGGVFPTLFTPPLNYSQEKEGNSCVIMAHVKIPA